MDPVIDIAATPLLAAPIAAAAPSAIARNEPSSDIVDFQIKPAAPGQQGIETGSG